MSNIYSFLLGLIFVSVVFIGIPSCAMGNHWFDSDNIIRCVQQCDDNAEKVIGIDRNVISLSEVLVQMYDGSEKLFYIDSNLIAKPICHDRKTAFD